MRNSSMSMDHGGLASRSSRAPFSGGTSSDPRSPTRTRTPFSTNPMAWQTPARRRARALTQHREGEDGTEEIATFIDVPEGAGPGEEIVASLPGDQVVSVIIPDDAKIAAGDFLEVQLSPTTDKDEFKAEVVRHIRPPIQTYRKQRTIVTALGVSAMLLIFVALFMPWWMQVESAGGSSKTDEYVGMLSVYRDGYSQRWRDIVEGCHDALEKLQDASQERREALRIRCESDSRLANLGWLLYGGNLAMLFFQAWGCITAVGSRQSAAVMLLAFAIILHGVLSMFWVTQVHRIVNVKHVASSYWFDIGGFVLQIMCLFLMLVVRIRTEQTSRLLGLDFQFLENAAMKAKIKESKYTWDETNPGEGCPVIWRIYGFTPAGLYESYKNRPFGKLRAILLYAASAPFHFLKTFDWNGVRLNWYGPASEVECIRRQGVSTSVVIHYMMYRRSNIICTVVFMFVLLCYRLRDLLTAIEIVHGDEGAAKTARLKSFEEYQRDYIMLGTNASFVEYSKDAFFQAVAAVNLQSAGLAIWKALIRVFFLLIAVIYSCGAMVQWDKFRSSMYCLIAAWFGILAHPIIISFVPSSTLLDWTVFDSVTNNYLTQARVHLKIDEMVTGCFLQEPTELLDITRSYVAQICPMLIKLPYVVPSSFKVGPGIWVKTEWIPYISEQFPPGTNLKGMHSLCSQVTSVTMSDSTMYSAEIIRDGCTTVASFLQRNTVPEVSTLLKQLAHLALKGVSVDSGTLQAVHTLQFPQEDVDGGLPSVISLRFYRAPSDNHTNMRGTLRKLQDNPEGCGALGENAYPDNILVFGPLTKAGCELSVKLEHAKRANVRGLVLIDPDSIVRTKKDVPTYPDVSVAMISSRLQGYELMEYLKRHDQGIEAVVQHQHFNWEDRHSRTSHGCHCKGRGFYSDCRVREAGILDQKQKDAEPYPWCETSPLDHMGQPCPVHFDLCVPVGQTSASQSPGGKCLSGFCGRQAAHSTRDTCERETSGWMGLIGTGKEVGCVPPQGLIGSLAWSGKPVEEVQGSSVDFQGSMENISLSGTLLTLTKWYSCEFRLVVEGPSQQYLKIGKKISTDGKPIEIQAGTWASDTQSWVQSSSEMAIQIEVSAATSQSLNATRLEQKCQPKEGPTRRWETVRLEQLRHQEPEEDSLRRSSEPKQPSILRSRSEYLKTHQLRLVSSRSRSAHFETGRQVRAVDSASTVLTDTDSTPPPLQARLSATYQDLPGNASDLKAWTCTTFVGDVCITSGLKKRCGENQVCNASSEGFSSSYCSCAIGYCWSYIRNACVEQSVHAHEVVSRLFNDTLIDRHAPRLWETVKGAATIAVSMKESGENLWTVLRHVLAIGPGLLISAWTAKVIFVRSTIPGYFAYFFPWMYSPIAWSLYNVAHQSLAEPRLSLAFGILSFWTIPVAMAGMKYGLHKPLSVARAMSLTNNLLFFYYFWLIVAILLIVWFVIAWYPEGNDYLTERLRDDWHPSMWIKDAVLAQDLSGFWESFAIYFLTCAAACDFLTSVIVKEHETAWLLLQKSAPRLGPQETPEDLPHTFLSTLATEEQVTRDWLLLINDRRVSGATSGTACVEGALVARGNQDACRQRRQEQQDDIEGATSVPSAVELCEISRNSKSS